MGRESYPELPGCVMCMLLPHGTVEKYGKGRKRDEQLQ
jgi:hypothetical protein